MPASPLAISEAQLKAHLVGLGDLLAAQAAFTGLLSEDLAKEAIQSAQSTLRERTRVSFFVRRFCTAELARQDNLAQGADFDEYVNPTDFVMRQWRNHTGRTKARWAPIQSIQKLMLTLASGGKVLEVPPVWCNIEAWRGQVHVIPYGTAAINYVTYYSLVGVLAMNRAALGAGVIPAMVHMRYTAGMVSEHLAKDEDYDPLDPGEATIYPEELVREYQRAVGVLAAAHVIRDVARELDKGGVAVAFDGLSRSVNPQVLEQTALGFEQRATDWADTFRGQHRGVRMTVV